MVYNTGILDFVHGKQIQFLKRCHLEYRAMEEVQETTIRIYFMFISCVLHLVLRNEEGMHTILMIFQVYECVSHCFCTKLGTDYVLWLQRNGG
jgi:hypothetical protein